MFYSLKPLPLPLNLFKILITLSRLRCVTFIALVVLGAAQPLVASPPSFLMAQGTNLCNEYGRGDVVPLRGVNLGSWLLMESWMSPMDASGLPDYYSVLQTLNNRFGVTNQEGLVRTYQAAWLTTKDLDNIRAMGMNCVRLPFWWGNVQRLDGAWRTDAFTAMDWLVTNAWQRGIYTVIDFHGLPGGQSASDSTAQANQNQYWTNVTDQLQTSLIWSKVAAHFAGNPAVAGYDLINEPYGAPSQTAIWAAYNSLYHTVRAVDPAHIIIMEGCWSGTGTNGQALSWQWDVLPPPTLFGWTNVVYSMHAYAGTMTTNGEEAETDKQVSDFVSHQAWNVPCFIGEFNSHGIPIAWPFSILNYDRNGMSWDNWAYKAIAGGVGNSWGIYDPAGAWPSIPNIQTDSASSISNSWSQWTTIPVFGLTPFLKQYLGAPIAVDDFYTNIAGTLAVTSQAGVLANDLDTNLNISGISLSAVLVKNPVNGQLNFNTNGAFTYSPNPGFSGVDTFQYRAFDQYVNSASIATVSISNRLAVYPVTDGTNYIAGIINVGQGVFALAFIGTPGGQYYVQTTTNLAGPINWQTIPGSTNSVSDAGGAWTYTVTNADRQRYYRSAAIVP